MSRDIFIFNNRNNPAEGYYHITEAELQLYKKSCDGKPYIINLGYALMEVSEADYKDFYKVRRREKHIQEEAIRVGEFSYNAFDTEDYDGASAIADDSEALEDSVIRKMMIEKLPEAVATLAEEEKELVYQLYFNHKSERQLAFETGISNVAVNKRKNKVLSKLKKYFEICG